MPRLALVLVALSRPVFATTNRFDVLIRDQDNEREKSTSPKSHWVNGRRPALSETIGTRDIATVGWPPFR